MKEAVFILLVIAILLAITAVRYRKQITGFISFARAVKDATSGDGAQRTINDPKPGVQLVNCAKCGVWVPENKTVSRGGKSFCSKDCALKVAT